MQARAEVVSHSPSFNSNSMTEIAARVVEECAAEEKSDEFYGEFYFERELDSESVKREGEEWDLDEDEVFEFKFETRDSESSPISADEIFHDGKIRPVYPFFDGDLLKRKVKMDGTNVKNSRDGQFSTSNEENGKKTIQLTLRNLLIEERETAAMSSCSSSDVDELEGVPEEMYCVWRPKSAPAAAEETVRRCKKSSSTGAIYKKLKLKELLRRSHSEGGKDNFVLLTPKNIYRKRENEEKSEEKLVVAGKVAPPAAPPRRTYLPYRQDLVGFFSGVNGLSKNSKTC